MLQWLEVLQIAQSLQLEEEEEEQSLLMEFTHLSLRKCDQFYGFGTHLYSCNLAVSSLLEFISLSGSCLISYYSPVII